MRFRIIVSLFFTTVLLCQFSDNNAKSTFAEPENQECSHRIILSLVIDPKQTDNIYLSIRTRPGLSPFMPDNVEFHKSTDGGKNWQAILRMKGGEHSSLAINPYDSQIIYAGRYKSSDGGKTWEPSGIPSDIFSYLTIHPTDTNIVYAITMRDIYKTISDNKNWFIIKKDCRAFAMDIRKPNELYAYCGEKSGEGIYKSIDSGVSWERMFHVNDITPFERYARAMHSRVPKFTIAINPKDSTIYAAGLQNIYCSYDGGQKWDVIKNEFPDNMRINVLTTDPVRSNTLYIGTTNNGIFKSIDRGLNWHKINNGLPEKIFVEFLVINPQNSDIIYIGTSSNGIYKSLNGGESWQSINKGLPCSPLVLLQ